MADGGNRVSAAEKAAGISVASLGGLTILHDLHFFEQGSFDLGGLLHLHFAGGTAGVTVHDGGVSLKCDPQWSVRPFAVGKRNSLDGDAVRGDDNVASPALAEQVRILAGAIARDAPAGSILLIGSGDDNQSRSRNAPLALDRAKSVKQLLDEGGALASSGSASREILLANEALTLAAGDSAGSGSLSLARLLYGADEASARSVQACVLQPRPHGVEISGSGQPPPDFMGGFAAGFVAALLVALLFASIAYVVLTRSRRKREEAAATSPPAAPAGRRRQGPKRGS